MFKKYVNCAISMVVILTFFHGLSETDCASTLIGSRLRNREHNSHYIDINEPSDRLIKTQLNFALDEKLVTPSSNMSPSSDSLNQIKEWRRNRRSPYPPAFYLESPGCNCLPGKARCICSNSSNSSKKKKSHKWVIYQ